MTDALSTFELLSQTLRTALLVGGVGFAGLAALDWAVRTRRINPFGGVARFMRGRVEPRLAGIERSVVRVGGKASATPWWALVAYVVIAALLLAGVDFVYALVQDVGIATSAGPMGVLRLVLRWVIGFLRIALLVRVVASWIPALSHSRWTTWSHGATEWMLRPLRRLLPTFGMMDLSPLVAYFGLYVVEVVLSALVR